MKVGTLRKLVVFFATFLVASPALANDSSFGGRGADPMPLKNDQVEMVAEHIVIRADQEKNVWNVHCDFTFRNTTDEKVDLQIGFPFPAADGMGDVAVPPGKDFPEQGEPLVWDFESRVRGKKVKVKKKDVKPNPKLPRIHYDTVFLWDVTFEPGETVKIENTYVHGISSDVMGMMWVSYVLKTGSLWKGGKIGRSRLEVHAGPDMLLPPEKERKKQELRPITVKPDGARIVRREDGGVSLYWDLKKFAPTEDLHVDFVRRGSLWPFLGIDFSDEALSHMPAAKLRIVRNTISAVHGYVFESKDLRKHFEEQWWYRPDPDFEVDDLSDHEKKLIRRVKKYEQKAK